MVRNIENQLYKVNLSASSFILEVDADDDPENEFLRKELQLECYGSRLNLLVYLARLSASGCCLSGVTEFNVDGSRPKVAFLTDKDFKKILKYFMSRSGEEQELNKDECSGKKIWFRVGMEAEITDEEMEQLKVINGQLPGKLSVSQGYALMESIIERASLSGETYIVGKDSGGVDDYDNPEQEVNFLF